MSDEQAQPEMGRVGMNVPREEIRAYGATLATIYVETDRWSLAVPARIEEDEHGRKRVVVDDLTATSFELRTGQAEAPLTTSEVVAASSVGDSVAQLLGRDLAPSTPKPVAPWERFPLAPVPVHEGSKP